MCENIGWGREEMTGSKELYVMEKLVSFILLSAGECMCGGWGEPLEKEMATHSRIFAWRIPWTEESGGLQSMGSQESDMTYD